MSEWKVLFEENFWGSVREDDPAFEAGMEIERPLPTVEHPVDQTVSFRPLLFGHQLIQLHKILRIGSDLSLQRLNFLLQSSNLILDRMPVLLLLVGKFHLHGMRTSLSCAFFGF